MTGTVSLRTKALIVSCSFFALSACDTSKLGSITDVFKKDTRVTETAPRPLPDARGVLTYPNYQVIVAKRGDSISDLASRVGMAGAELARFNGLPLEYSPRNGELLALPASIRTSPSGATETISTTTLDDGDQAPVVGTVQSGEEPTRHIVENGETAFSIARLYGVSVTALASWNGLDRDLSVRNGQQLLIPVSDETARAAPVASTTPGTGSLAPNPPSSIKPLPATVAVASVPDSPNLASDRTPDGVTGKMVRPVSGKVIRGYSKARGGNQGLDIAASAGSSVKAADAGEVALVSKSSGQSTIVLIRHPDNLYTVYSNITDVSVKKGQKISRGSNFAKVASGDPSFLHFEIRRGTESVDPAPFL